MVNYKVDYELLRELRVHHSPLVRDKIKDYIEERSLDYGLISSLSIDDQMKFCRNINDRQNKAI